MSRQPRPKHHHAHGLHARPTRPPSQLRFPHDFPVELHEYIIALAVESTPFRIPPKSRRNNTHLDLARVCSLWFAILHRSKRFWRHVRLLAPVNTRVLVMFREFLEIYTGATQIHLDAMVNQKTSAELVKRVVLPFISRFDGFSLNTTPDGLLPWIAMASDGSLTSIKTFNIQYRFQNHAIPLNLYARASQLLSTNLEDLNPAQAPTDDDVLGTRKKAQPREVTNGEIETRRLLGIVHNKIPGMTNMHELRNLSITSVDHTAINYRHLRVHLLNFPWRHLTTAEFPIYHAGVKSLCAALAHCSSLNELTLNRVRHPIDLSADTPFVSQVNIEQAYFPQAPVCLAKLTKLSIVDTCKIPHALPVLRWLVLPRLQSLNLASTPLHRNTPSPDFLAAYAPVLPAPPTYTPAPWAAANPMGAPVVVDESSSAPPDWPSADWQTLHAASNFDLKTLRVRGTKVLDLAEILADVPNLEELDVDVNVGGFLNGGENGGGGGRAAVIGLIGAGELGRGLKRIQVDCPTQVDEETVLEVVEMRLMSVRSLEANPSRSTEEDQPSGGLENRPMLIEDVVMRILAREDQKDEELTEHVKSRMSHLEECGVRVRRVNPVVGRLFLR